MRMYFWQFCDVNNCIREWIFFILTFFIFLFTIYSVVNTYRYHKRIIFQLLPLSINCLATGVLVILQLLEKGFEYHLATYLIQIYTYFLFCYTFTVMYIRVNAIEASETLKKILKIIFCLFSVSIVILLVFVFTKGIKASCQKVFTDEFYIFFALQVMFYAITLFFGLKILIKMNSQQQYEARMFLIKTESTQDHKLLSQDQYRNQRKMQINIILLSYTLTIALRISSIILNNIFAKQIKCIFIDQAYVRGSDSVLGKSIIIINSIVQLIPHVLVPIAMYIIPSTKNTEILSQEKIIMEEQVIDTYMDMKQEQHVRQRLSSLIISGKSQLGQNDQITRY